MNKLLLGMLIALVIIIIQLSFLILITKDIKKEINHISSEVTIIDNNVDSIRYDVEEIYMHYWKLENWNTK
jgi:uncharacterized protein YoxC